MPIEPIDLQRFCVAELNAEKDEWRELLKTPIGEILARDIGAEVQLSSDRTTLQPCSPTTFREGEKIALVPDDAAARAERLGDALRGAQLVFIDGIATDGALLLQRRCPIEGSLLALPTGPLLDIHGWHKGILQRWLEHANASERATELRELLGSAPQAEQPIPLGTMPGERAEMLGSALRGPSAITLVQGPPGCGKTVLAADWIASALSAGHSVGAWAFTNRACDGLLRTLHERRPDLASSARRLGNPGGHRRDLAALGIGQAKALAPQEGSALGTTLFQIAKATSRTLEEGRKVPEFDIAFVDEASQATLPMLASALAASRRLVLLGDQRQLGPVLKSKPSEESPELHQSAFEFLAARRPVHFLSETRRMRPSVCRLPSNAFYQGRLRSVVDWTPAPNLAIGGEPFLRLEPGLELIEVSVGARVSATPQDEVECLLKIVRAWATEPGASLLASAAKQLGSSPAEPHLLISCFYRRQVVRIRSALADLPYLAALRIHVDTVERNQGASSLLSLLSVADDGAPASGKHPLEWRLDPRRLNVAVTRGRIKAYVIASSRFLDLATSRANLVSRDAWSSLRNEVNAPTGS